MSNVFNPTPMLNGSGTNFFNRVPGITVAYPLIALGSSVVSATVPGVKAGDSVSATINASTTLAVGLAIGGCRVTADNTVAVTFVTPLALGVTAGSVKLDFLIMGTR